MNLREYSLNQLKYFRAPVYNACYIVHGEYLYVITTTDDSLIEKCFYGSKDIDKTLDSLDIFYLKVKTTFDIIKENPTKYTYLIVNGRLFLPTDAKIDGIPFASGELWMNILHNDFIVWKEGQTLDGNTVYEFGDYKIHRHNLMNCYKYTAWYNDKRISDKFIPLSECKKCCEEHFKKK